MDSLGLARSHAKLAQIVPVLDIKASELDQLVVLVSRYSMDPTLGDPDKIMESMLGNMTEVVTLSNQVTASGVVIHLLEEALGGQYHFLRSYRSPFSLQTPSFSGILIKQAASYELLFTGSESTLPSFSATDDQGAAQPHDFKGTAFTIPTSCAHW